MKKVDVYEFYRIEMEVANDQGYNDFVKFIFGDHPENCTRMDQILNFDVQLRYNEYCKLKELEKQTNGKSLYDFIINIENYKQTGKKYRYLYFNVRHWMERHIERQPKITNDLF